jgi:hypothetical protein
MSDVGVEGDWEAVDDLIGLTHKFIFKKVVDVCAECTTIAHIC